MHERRTYRRLVDLKGEPRVPDETTILRFRHTLEMHEFAPQALTTISAGLADHGLLHKTVKVVDATILAGPSSTEHMDGGRDPEMHHQSRKGKQWHLNLKAHNGVDAESGLKYDLIEKAANVNNGDTDRCTAARRGSSDLR